MKELISGPDGKLELELIENNSDTLAIVCHPHPLFEGTMNNKVVTSLIRAFKEKNYHTIRFNFRGVENSEGHYASGIGECDDLLAVIDWAKTKIKFEKLILSGFSFGSYVAARVAQDIDCEKLILVAPPVHHFNFDNFEFDCPIIVAQGLQDEVVPAELVTQWFEKIKSEKHWLEFPNATHFFHGELVYLRENLFEDGL